MERLRLAWLQLCALTLASTAVAYVAGQLSAQFAGTAVATALLITFAFFKARIILGTYLHLASAPGWLGAASSVLGIWLALICGLYLI